MSHLTSNAIDTITKPIKYVNCFFSVTHFGLGHEGGVDIPKLKHWVLTPKSDKIAINCSIDFLRKQNKRFILSWEELPPNAEDMLQAIQKHPALSQIVEKKEFVDILGEAVRQLPSGQRRVFYLRYGEELRIKDIALRLNRSEGTIKSHLHHAHRKLRDLLRPYLQNEPLGWLRTS